MESLTIKNISDELREVAERGRRSITITQQVLYMLEQALTVEGGTTIPAEVSDDEDDDKERP